MVLRWYDTAMVLQWDCMVMAWYDNDNDNYNGMVMLLIWYVDDMVWQWYDMIMIWYGDDMIW